VGITIGLYYNGARYLAAWLGRWTSADPIGIGADGPGLYNYTRGSPVNYTDPSGTQVPPEEPAARSVDVAGNYYDPDETPLCQRPMRQTLLAISVLTGGEWCFDRAQEIPGFSS
jgi:uncharacterized protein RhaS with RHS repeats